MRNPMTRVSRRGRVTIAVLVVVFLLFTLFDRVVGAWADYLWFSEVKYPQVFTGVLTTRIWTCGGERRGESLDPSRTKKRFVSVGCGTILRM